MNMTITDKMRIINRDTSPHPSLDALRYMRSLVSHEHLNTMHLVIEGMNDKQAMALPHLMVLSDAESDPFVRFVAARWLHQNHLAEPAAVAAFIELAFDDDKEIAFEALGLLEASDSQQAFAMLQALIKWEDTEKIHQKVSDILSESDLGDNRGISIESKNELSMAEVLFVEPEAADLGHEHSSEKEQSIILSKQEPKAKLAGLVRLPPMPLAVTKPHSIIWHEPVLSTLPAVGALVRRLPYSYDKPYRYPLLILALTTIAELFTLSPEPRLGILLHFSTLMILFYNVLVAGHQKLRRLHTALLLIPLVRLVSLGLPLSFFPQISWYFMVSLPLFVAIGVTVQQEKWRREELGLTLRHLPLQLMMGLSGLGLGGVEYLILEPQPWVNEFTWQAIWWPALILLVSTGFFEELLFRGLLQNAAMSIMRGWSALFFVATLFAVLHIGYISALDFLFVFAVGLAFGIFAWRTGSILGVTLAHGLINISLFLIWPLLLG